MTRAATDVLTPYANDYEIARELRDIPPYRVDRLTGGRFSATSRFAVRQS